MVDLIPPYYVETWLIYEVWVTLVEMGVRYVPVMLHTIPRHKLCYTLLSTSPYSLQRSVRDRV